MPAGRLGRRASAVSPAGIAAGLESLHDFDLGDFHVDFGPGKHTGSRFIDLTMLTRDGKVRY